jgi:tetratricopeptide (TPR) repeat protein
MKKVRRKTRKFDPVPNDFRGAIHFLLRRGMPRKEIADLFDKSPNLISVHTHNEQKQRTSPGTATTVSFNVPDTSKAKDEFLPEPWSRSLSALEEDVHAASVAFWPHVRALDGIGEYNRLLQRLSRPSEDNIRGLQLRARLKHLIAESYLHVGYALSATFTAIESLDLELAIYQQTESRLDLANYAKTAVLLSQARLHRDERELAWSVLELAEQAHVAAHIPVNPAIYQQRATIQSRYGNIDAAKELLGKAYTAFQDYRAYMGFGSEDHARHDVSVRPLALLTGNFESAIENIAVAAAWPSGDIHLAINMNAAIAVSMLSDSAEAKDFAEDRFQLARALSQGYGVQTTAAILLEMTPRILEYLRRSWVRFALDYNAYRNR